MLIAAAVIVIFLAVLIPSVVLRAAPQTDTDPPRTPIKYTAEPDLLRLVEKALKEVPLIDTHNALPFAFYKDAGNHFAQFDISKDMTNKTHTDIPRMRKGLMGGQFFAAYGRCDTQYKDAIEMGMMQVDVIRRMAEKWSDDFEFIGTADGKRVINCHLCKTNL